MSGASTCTLDVNTTLPLVCISTLLSFLCGVGIGANDLSANFAMVVGSGSLNMKQAIIYCTVFELLGAAFMGGHVSNTIRNGIVDPALFAQNKDVVVIGMTCASFAAALWLYLSTVFGLPVSITHTVVGSILGFAIFAAGGLTYVKSSGVAVIVVSWLAAPLAACGATALLFYVMRRDIFKVKGRSFELALLVLPYCLLGSLMMDFFFILIAQPPVMTKTLAAYVPVAAQYVILFLCILLFCWVSQQWVFPQVAAAAMSAQSFVWESEALRTEPVEEPADGVALEDVKNLSFFRARGDASGAASTVGSNGQRRPSPSATPAPGGATAAADGPAATEAVLASPSLEGMDETSVPAVPTAEPELQESHSAAGGPAHSRPHTPAPAPLHQNASFVLSSISGSDGGFVRKGGRVRLTPVHTRGHSPAALPRSLSGSTMSGHVGPSLDVSYLPGCNLASSDRERREMQQPQHPHHQPLPQAGRVPGFTSYGGTDFVKPPSAFAATAAAAAPHARLPQSPYSPVSVHSEDEFGEEDWAMDHPMQPIRFGGILIKPFNPRAEYLFTGLQVVAGSMSSFVHGAVAGANATVAFVILYDAFTNHELQTPGLSSQWSVLPAMLGIAIGMFGLGASLMKTVGMELVTVTPARGWCIQVGGTAVTMVLTGIGIPVSLSQAQVGAAIGCGVLDAKLGGVSWGIVTKVVTGWVVTLIISAVTTGVSMWLLSSLFCG